MQFGSPKIRVIAQIVVGVAILLAGGLWLYARHGQVSMATGDHPEYLSFPGKFVFTIPKSYSVSERSVPGVLIVYPGNLTAKTLDEAYGADAVALRPVTGLTDHTSAGFKKYVNEVYIPELRKSLATDVQADFASIKESDVARLHVSKAGEPYRFVFLKNGQHPVSVVGKSESDAFKKIEQTVTDVESSDLKNEFAPLSISISQTVQLIKDQKASELYSQAAADLRSKNSETDVYNALKSAAPYMQGTTIIDGGGYNVNPDELAVVINFVPNTTNGKPASGIMYIDKINGQWALKGLKLPGAPTASADQTSPKQ